MKNLTKSMIKVLSMYFFFTGLSTLISLFSNVIFQKGVSFGNFLSTASFPITYICIGIFLWYVSGALANIIAGKNTNKSMSEDETTQLDMKSENFDFNMLLTALIIAVGFILCGGAIPKLIGAIFSLIISQNPDATSFIIQERVIMMESLIKTIIGIILVFGAKGIANFVRKLRTFGLNDNQNS